MKQALIYNPYLDLFGGGEVYTLRFAQALVALDYRIDIAWHSPDIALEIKRVHGLNLESFTFRPELYKLFQSGSLVQKILKLRSYHGIFFLSDGSIPFLFGRQNWLHFQVPFSQLVSSRINQLKLSNQSIVCNSIFTRQVIESRLQKSAMVLYPPVDMKATSTKTKTILGVGRFTEALHHKRQDILIQAFQQLVDSGVDDWKLVLVGNQAKGDNLVDRYQELIGAYPIEIKTNVPYEELNQSYGQAQIFWHAAGFGIDETKEPEKVEHFGMSTVEAMSARAVPVVINKGGQKEIVEQGVNGYLFNSVNDLVTYTQALIAHPDKRNQLAQAAQKRAEDFSIQSFNESVKQLVRNRT